MANMSLRLFGVMLLAGASCMWAQNTPTPPEPPAPAPAPQASETTDQDQAQADAEKARAEAEKEARRAGAEARKEAAKARAEASKARAQARKEVEKHRVMMMREGGSYLGVVDPRDVTSDRISALKLKEERGVEANGIDRDSPAGKAGLREHDVIMSFNGQQIEGVEQLRRMLRETPAGRTVALGIVRNGQPMSVNVTLAKRPDAFAMGNFNSFAMPKVPIPPMPPMDIDVPQISVLQYSTRNGVMVEDLTTQLGEFFGVKDGQGVLVRSVQKGSSADAAGLRAGDVIVKAGNEKITCSSDWRRAMRENKGGALSVGVVRDKHEQNVTMKLPEKQTSENHFHFEMQDLQKELDELQPQIEMEVYREMAAHRGDLERLKVRVLKFQKDMQQELQSR